MKVRAATEHDLNELVRMLGELFAIESDFVPNPIRQRVGLRLMLEHPRTSPVWVAEADGGVIGMCSLQILISTAQGSRVGLVEDLFIKAKYRRSGAGRTLLSHVVAWAKNNGLTRLQLLCDADNSPALEFYEKTQWCQTRLICMRKSLD